MPLDWATGLKSTVNKLDAAYGTSSQIQEQSTNWDCSFTIKWQEHSVNSVYINLQRNHAKTLQRKRPLWDPQDPLQRQSWWSSQTQDGKNQQSLKENPRYTQTQKQQPEVPPDQEKVRGYNQKGKQKGWEGTGRDTKGFPKERGVPRWAQTNHSQPKPASYLCCG